MEAEIPIQTWTELWWSMVITMANLMAFVVFVLTVLCKLNPKVKFYVKQTLMALGLVVNSIILVPYGFLNFGKIRKISRFSGNTIDFIGKSLFGITWKIEFEEPVNQDRAFVMVCNHQSALDVYGMLVNWKHIGTCITTAKNELKYTGPFGIALWLSGTLFIKRSNSDRARQTLNSAAQKLKSEGTSIWIFPEGTRVMNPGGEMSEFKKGAFHIAVDNKLPILPVVISPYGNFYRPERCEFEDGGQPIMKFLKPIEVEGTDFEKKENINDLIKLTHSTMTEAIKELNSRQNNNSAQALNREEELNNKKDN